MKNKLIILIITVCIVFQLARLEGYGYVRVREGFQTTAEREEQEHVSDIVGNATLTESQENVEHRGGVNNAEVTRGVEKGQQRSTVERNIYYTSPEETTEHRGGMDHARLTAGQEKQQHVADTSVNARSTSETEKRNRYRSEMNSSTTAQVERESRQPMR